MLFDNLIIIVNKKIIYKSRLITKRGLMKGFLYFDYVK
jgi:hypothetical protein